MGWRDDVDREMKGIVEALSAGNAGRARTCARSAVGFALAEWEKRDARKAHGTDTMDRLRSFAESSDMPAEPRAAAQRLADKLAPDFTSASVHPLNDATIIVQFVAAQMRESYSSPSTL